jgi:AbiU2
MDRINEARIHAGLMAISDALYEGAVLALARLWDPHSRTATLIAAAELIKQEKVRTALEALSGVPIDRKDLKAWRRDVEAVKGSSQLDAIRKARNRALAHSEDPNQGGDNTPVRMSLYENDIWVLDRTITIFDRFNTWAVFGATDGPFSDRRLRVNADAARFWDHVAGRLA